MYKWGHDEGHDCTYTSLLTKKLTLNYNCILCTLYELNDFVNNWTLNLNDYLQISCLDSTISWRRKLQYVKSNVKTMRKIFKPINYLVPFPITMVTCTLQHLTKKHQIFFTNTLRGCEKLHPLTVLFQVLTFWVIPFTINNIQGIPFIHLTWIL